MSARTKRTLYRLLAVFLAAGAGDAIIQFVSSDSYDWRHLIAGLVTAAIIAVEQYLKSSDSSMASPSVNAVDAALQNQSPNVPPPKVAVDQPAFRIKAPDPNIPGPGV
jgi:hypothetical protein